MKKKQELTEEQKQKALLLFEENPDLNFIVRKVGEDETLDGRSVLGRAIRTYLISQGKEYNPQGYVKKTQTVELTESQKQFLMSNQINGDTNPIEAARLCFKDESIKLLSTQYRCVLEFLKRYRSEIVDDSLVPAHGKWLEPKSIETVIRKVNKWCHTKLPLNLAELNVKHKKCIERLDSYLKIYKFLSTINSLKTETDRDLFESEFVRAVWDKPDLTVDELNLYMMICSNHVRSAHIQKRLDSFNVMLESEDLESNDISIKLTEHCKAINDELNNCEKRIESLTQKLNGDRAKRLELNKSSNSSILSLVETFQEHEERVQMVTKAKIRSSLVKREAEKLEDMDEFRARIFGIGIDELI